MKCPQVIKLFFNREVQSGEKLQHLIPSEVLLHSPLQQLIKLAILCIYLELHDTSTALVRFIKVSNIKLL